MGGLGRVTPHAGRLRTEMTCRFEGIAVKSPPGLSWSDVQAGGQIYMKIQKTENSFLLNVKIKIFVEKTTNKAEKPKDAEQPGQP